MGNRLSKIVTRTGDDGSTGLGDQTRVSKNHLRIQAIGDVDELNSSIGVLLAETLPTDISICLQNVQHQLFNLGSDLCIPGRRTMSNDTVVQLEQWAEAYNAQLLPLREFVLPGGVRSAALAHMCRTICRRTERTIIGLHLVDPIPDEARQYVNRLSDLFFIIARLCNVHAGHPDVLWQSERTKT